MRFFIYETRDIIVSFHLINSTKVLISFFLQQHYNKPQRFFINQVIFQHKIYCSQYIVLLLLTIAIYCMLEYHLIYKEAYYYNIVKERMNARIHEIEKSRVSYIKNLMFNYNHNSSSKHQLYQVEFSHVSSSLLLHSMYFVTKARQFKIVPIWILTVT